MTNEINYEHKLQKLENELRYLSKLQKVKPLRRQGPSTTRVARNLTQDQLNAFREMLSSSLKENNLKQSILGLQKYRSQSQNLIKI